MKRELGLIKQRSHPEAHLPFWQTAFAGVINKRLYICGGLDESRH